MKEKTKQHKKLRITCIVVAAFMIALISAFFIYVSDYCHADGNAVSAMESASFNTYGYYAFGNSEAQTAFIFYPGGKVEATAYAPLMKALSEKNIFCVCAKMPCNLAFLKTDAAKKITEDFPDLKRVYIGGHSLGGVAAASYASAHSEDFDGVILLASYSTADISRTELKALSVYGTCDGVLNIKSLEKNQKNLPDDFTSFIINGGCHSYFGSYGMQKGDFEPTITADEQVKITVNAIQVFMENNND